MDPTKANPASVTTHATQSFEGSEPAFRSVLDGMSAAAPALALAQRVQERAAKVGFDWPTSAQAFAKIEEELQEVKQALEHGGDALSSELGDLLFAVVNVIRKEGREAELILHAATDKFTYRFQQLEALLQQRALQWDKLSLEEMDSFWEEIKVAAVNKKQ